MIYVRYILLFLCFVSGCKFRNIYDSSLKINVNPISLAPLEQRDFFTLKSELAFLFPQDDEVEVCDMFIKTNKNIVFSGLTSSAFATNKNIAITCNYKLDCGSIHINRTIVLDSDYAAIQNSVFSDYSTEQKISDDLLKRIAKMIYDDVKMTAIEAGL